MPDGDLDMAKDAIEKLKAAQTNISEAYLILVESGLHPRFAKSICKSYINISLKSKE